MRIMAIVNTMATLMVPCMRPQDHHGLREKFNIGHATVQFKTAGSDYTWRRVLLKQV